MYSGEAGEEDVGANGSNHVCIIPFTDKVMQDRKNNYNIANESSHACVYCHTTYILMHMYNVMYVHVKTTTDTCIYIHMYSHRYTHVMHRVISTYTPLHPHSDTHTQIMYTNFVLVEDKCVLTMLYMYNVDIVYCLKYFKNAIKRGVLQ